MYVAAIHDSFPHAMELSEKGYNAFALIYRPHMPAWEPVMGLPPTVPWRLISAGSRITGQMRR